MSVPLVCLALFLVLLPCSLAYELPDFKQWSAIHLPGATQERLDAVYPTWKKNAEIVESHNHQSGHQYQLTLNKFAHLTPDQVPKISPRFTPHADTWSPPTNEPPPDSFDWRRRNAVTSIHNQGQTGCSTVIPLSDAISGLRAIKTGLLAQISTKQLIDCCWNCNCSSLDLINYQCISKLDLCSSSDYPNVTSPTCTCLQGTGCDFHITGEKRVTRGDESALLQAVLVNPVVASMDASHTSFQLYKSGVYSSLKCSFSRLDHVVLIVGYGEEDGHKYWICKNSWGEDWGMGGYFLLARRHGNMCGIATAASYPYI